MSSAQGQPPSLSRQATQIDSRFSKLAREFSRYVAAFDSRGPFSATQLELHRATISRRRDVGSACVAATDDRFVGLLYDTLRAWRIGVRASRLIPRARFADALRSCAGELASLDASCIDDRALDVDRTAAALERLIRDLAIVDNQAKLVAGTKTLHHLLPDLVPPMDRAWTGRFLGLAPPQWQTTDNQAWIFRTVFAGLRRVSLTNEVKDFVGVGWHSSKTKVLDNALVGYCIIELPQTEGARKKSPSLMAGSHSSYHGLTLWLNAQADNSVNISFADFERIIGRPLPASALQHRPWWANHAGHAQARAWLGAGWMIESVDLRTRRATFRRVVR